MPNNMNAKKSVSFALLTVSDTRDRDHDLSGAYLERAINDDGHRILSRKIVRDSIDDIRSAIRIWISDLKPSVIVITGGTGLKRRDRTPEAVAPLFDRELPGFGELFRWVSWKEIGAATIQSRATAGQIGSCLVFCLPGSPAACRTAWQTILSPQFDSRSKPCNFVDILPDL